MRERGFGMQPDLGNDEQVQGSRGEGVTCKDWPMVGEGNTQSPSQHLFSSPTNILSYEHRKAGRIG
jgi:hypothetical protein